MLEDLGAVAVAIIRKPVAVAHVDACRPPPGSDGSSVGPESDDVAAARLVVDIGETTASVTAVYAGCVLAHAGAWRARACVRSCAW